MENARPTRRRESSLMSPEDSDSDRIAFELRQIQRELLIIDQLITMRKKPELDEIKIRAAASSVHSVLSDCAKSRNSKNSATDDQQ